MSAAMLTQSHKREIARQAEKWWDERGRKLIPQHLNQNTPAPVVRGGQGPIVVVKSATEQDLNSGILMGREWSQLTPNEQANVMISYFEHTWLPQHPEVKMQKRRMQ